MVNLFSTCQWLLTKLLKYTGIYTIAIVILHFADVGQLTDWCITAWPWNWSCLCILYIHISCSHYYSWRSSYTDLL